MSVCGLSIFQGWGAWAEASPPSRRCKIIRHDNRLIAAHIKNSSCLQVVIWGVIWDALIKPKP